MLNADGTQAYVFTHFQEYWTESLFICATCASFQIEIVGLWCVTVADERT